MSRGNLTSKEAFSLYEDLLKESEVGFMIVDSSGMIVHANQPTYNMLKLNVSSDSHFFLESVDLPNREKAKRLLRNLETTGCVNDWEMSIYNGENIEHIHFTGLIKNDYMIFMLKPLGDSVHKLQNVISQVNSDLTNLNRELVRKQHQLELANKKINQMHSELSHKNKLMKQDLRTAKIVQKALLEWAISSHDKLIIRKEYHPADSVGGDLYDICNIDAFLTGILICDVSGHGVASALVMAVIKNIFRNHAPNYKAPHEFLEKLNKEFLEIFNHESFEHYATAYYIIIDSRINTLFYSGAGHPYPYLYSGETVEELISPGIPIGIFKQGNYDTKVVEYRNNDRLLLFTDGLEDYLTEIHGDKVNFSHYKWGTVTSVFKETAKHLKAKQYYQKDDVCMMIVEFISE